MKLTCENTEAANLFVVVTYRRQQACSVFGQQASGTCVAAFENIESYVKRLAVPAGGKV